MLMYDLDEEQRIVLFTMRVYLSTITVFARKWSDLCVFIKVHVSTISREMDIPYNGKFSRTKIFAI